MNHEETIKSATHSSEILNYKLQFGKKSFDKTNTLPVEPSAQYQFQKVGFFFDEMRKILQKNKKDNFVYEFKVLLYSKNILKCIKNIKTVAPRGAHVIRCKCYRVQLVRGPTGFHRNSEAQRLE